MEKGNIISYIFGQPGNDTTHGIVTRVENNKLDFYDVVFGMMIKDVEINSQIWIAKDEGKNIFWQDATGEKVIRKNVKEECEKYILNQKHF